MKTGMNQRDKTLLQILLIIVVLFLIYYFVLSPQYEVCLSLKSRLEAGEREYVRLSQMLKDVDGLKTEEAERKAALTDKYKVFFPEIVEERVLYRLNTLFLSAGLPVGEYRQTEVSALEITSPGAEREPLDYPLLEQARKVNPALNEDSSGDEASESRKKDDKQQPSPLPSADITIGFTEAEYESVMGLIGSLETMDRSLLIKSIEISKKDEPPTLDGEIVISVYSLPKLDDSEKDELIFRPTIEKGKTNPF